MQGPGLVYMGTTRVNVNPVRNFPVQGDPNVACPGNGPEQAPDTNDLEWITINTLSGAAQADVLVQLAKPRRKFVHISNVGNPTPGLLFYLSAFGGDKAAGGILAIDGTEHWFPLHPLIGNEATANVASVIEFAKPITRFYIAHPDYGTGTNIVIVASDDVSINDKQT